MLSSVLIATGPAGASAVPSPAHAVIGADGTETTVDFEAYPPGTEITNQYPGITFESPTAAGFTYGAPGPGSSAIVSPDTGGPPIVVASGAHDGTNAGELVAPGEFGAAGTFAAMTDLAGSVSVYIGDLADASVHVEMDTYDANRDFLGSATATTSVTGAQELLSYSASGAADIAYIAVYRSDHIGGEAVIDDLSFSVPASAPSEVGVTASTTSYELGQGGTRAIPLTVNRLDGATGPVSIAISGLPPGVTLSLSQDPVVLPSTGSTLTITASSTTALGNYVVTLTASATGSTSQAPSTLTLSIVAPMQLSAPASLPVGGCSSNHTTLTAQVAPGLSGPVNFSATLTSASPGLTYSLNPAQAVLSYGTAQVVLTVSSSGGSDPGTVVVTASLPGGGASTATITLERLGPEVTAVEAQGTSSLGTPIAGLAASTPQGERPGTTVEVYGQYFCTTATVSFGNSQASVTGIVGHTLGPQGPEDYLRVSTPRDATSGPVTVTTGSPPASASSVSSLTVDSYRNKEAFSFHNFDSSLNFQDLTNAFGSQQTYINVNPCGFFTLGVINCSVALVPDPVAAAVLAIAQATLQAGTCFGISLTDQRLVAGQLDARSYPSTGPSIYDLEGPPINDAQFATGAGPLLEVLKADHLQQFSTEFLAQWSGAALAQQLAPPAQVVAGIVKQIGRIFAAGRYPMLELNDGNGGGGHVVVAYDLVADGNGNYDIYVYDSNNPYSAGEDSDGSAHANAVSASVIHLFSNGTWTLASTTEPHGSPFQGGPGAIVVTDPASIPLHPTLATLGGLAPGLLFSVNGTTGPSGTEPTKIVQLTGPGGRALYRANGSLNTDPATRLDAVPFSPLVGPARRGTSGPQLFVVGPRVNEVVASTRGITGTSGTETFVDGGFDASVETTAAKGAAGQASFSASSGTVGIAGPTLAPTSLSVDRVSAAGSERVTVTFPRARTGADTLAFGPGGAISFSHQGPATTFTLALSSALHNGAPATFDSGPLPVGSGQTAVITGAHWSSLAVAKLAARVGSKTLTLHDRAPVVRLVRLATFKVAAAPRQTERLSVTGYVTRAGRGSRVAIIWVARDADGVVAKHALALGPENGPFHASWTVKLIPAKVLRATAGIVAVAGNGGTIVSSSVSRSLTFSVG
jgi:hypothetical protein